MLESADEFAGLLEQVRRGDDAALATLVQKYEQKVRLVARMLLGPALRTHLDSVDLVQSVHFTLLLGLRKEKFEIASSEKLVALAVTLVRRKVARHWRRLKREHRGPPTANQDNELLETLAYWSQAPADPARTAELNDEVERFWKSLDETERRVVEMRIDGYKTVEIAVTLGVAANVLRAHLSRMRKRLHAKGIFIDWL